MKPVNMCVWLCVVINLATASTYDSHVGFYPDLAMTTVVLDNIYIKTTEWKHTFTLAPPCHDTRELREHLAMTRDEISKLVNSLLLSTHEVSGSLLLTSPTKASVVQLTQLGKLIVERVDRSIFHLDDRVTNAETLWGWSKVSICANPSSIRAKRSAPLTDNEIESNKEPITGQAQRNDFYGAQIDQVFINGKVSQLDARHVQRHGAKESYSDTFNAVIQAREAIKLQGLHKFHDMLAQSYSSNNIVKTDIFNNLRGKGRPTNIDVRMKDQRGTHYSGTLEEVVPERGDQILVATHNLMGGTRMGPADADATGYYRNRRKRSLDFIGEAYHWATGVATDRQIRDVTKILDMYAEQLNTTGAFVKTSNKVIQSLSNSTSHMFASINKALTETQNALGETNKVIRTNNALLLESLHNVTSETAFLRLMTHTLIEMTECETKISILENTLTTSAEFYIFLSEAMISGILPLPLISAPQIINILKLVEAQLPDRYMLPPTLVYDDMLNRLPITVGISNGAVTMTLVLPVIDRVTKYKTYSVRSHPIYISGKWFRARVEHQIYIIDEANSRWIAMEKDDYLICLTNPFSVCKLPYVWNHNLDYECGVAAIVGSARLASICFMDLIHGDDQNRVIVTPIVDNTWIIAHNQVSLELVTKCQNGSDEHTTLTSLKSQTKVIMPVNCKGRVSSFVLSPTLDINQAISSASTIGDKYRYGELPVISIDTVKVDLQELPLKTLLDPHIVLNTTRPMISDGVALLQDLITASSDSETKYNTDIDMLAGHIKKLMKKVEADAVEGWTFTGWLSSLKWWFIGALAITILILISYLCIQCKLCSPRTTMLTTAAHLPLKGFAMPISTPSDDDTITIEVNMPILNGSLLTFTNDSAANTTARFYHYTTYLQAADFHVDMIYSILLMLVTIYLTKRLLTKEHRGVLARLGLFTKNTKISHHMGESSLVAFFLVKAHSICGTTHRVFEIPIELCTLPGLATEWRCEPSSGLKMLVKPHQWLRRWQWTFNIKVDWSNITIKSLAHPGVNACSEIPNVVSFDSNHVSHIISHHSRMDWTSLEVLSITGIAVSFPGYFNYIYHYAKATHHTNVETIVEY